MKIKVSKIVPCGYVAITLWPFGIYLSKDRYIQSKRIINHEKIHWHQQKETFGLFYPWYLIEWIIRVILPPWNTAYRDISFEVEAKKNDKNFKYLKQRKPFSWLKYIFNSKIIK